MERHWRRIGLLVGEVYRAASYGESPTSLIRIAEHRVEVLDEALVMAEAALEVGGDEATIARIRPAVIQHRAEHGLA
jgi:hypothetical protein